MSCYLVAAAKSWNIRNSEKLISKYPEHRFEVITNPYGLTEAFVREAYPEYIFFPHWSWMIPANIYENFKCIVFHMTDLPFGRGGSPLQNLIARGIYHTKISAIRAVKGLDQGDIYLKEPLDLSSGNADEILQRGSEIIYTKMIPRFIEETLIPEKQSGKAVTFKRRTPKQSEIPDGLTQRQLYDYIRMLDGEGYPAAYKLFGDRRVYFRNARFCGGTVYADAEFV